MTHNTMTHNTTFNLYVTTTEDWHAFTAKLSPSAVSNIAWSDFDEMTKTFVHIINYDEYSEVALQNDIVNLQLHENNYQVIEHKLDSYPTPIQITMESLCKAQNSITRVDFVRIFGELGHHIYQKYQYAGYNLLTLYMVLDGGNKTKLARYIAQFN